MADKIYALYRENKDRKLKNGYIYDIFDEMITKEPELMEYISDFFIVQKDNNSFGHYSENRRSICINKLAIENQSDIINPSLYVIEIIRHEMEHARNLKRLYAGKNDIESMIVLYAIRYCAMKYGLDYYPTADVMEPDELYKEVKKNYEINPGERLVEIKAWKYIINMFKNLRDSDELDLARRMLYFTLIKGYKSNRYYLEPPTYEFLLKTGMVQHLKWLKDQINAKDYSFDTRITYGLPISAKEYREDVFEKTKVF